jgi:hypothetical protein
MKEPGQTKYTYKTHSGLAANQKLITQLARKKALVAATPYSRKRV